MPTENERLSTAYLINLINSKNILIDSSQQTIKRQTETIKSLILSNQLNQGTIETYKEAALRDRKTIEIYKSALWSATIGFVIMFGLWFYKIISTC